MTDPGRAASILRAERQQGRLIGGPADELH